MWGTTASGMGGMQQQPGIYGHQQQQLQQPMVPGYTTTSTMQQQQQQHLPGATTGAAGAAGAAAAAGAAGAAGTNNLKHDIFVGNLAFNTTEEQLQTVFSEVGKVVNVRMVTDPDTGKLRGFAFVEFEDPQAALSAIRNMNEYELNGRKLRVNFSNSSHLEALAGKLGIDLSSNPNTLTPGVTNRALLTGSTGVSKTTLLSNAAASATAAMGGTQAVTDALKSFTKSEMYDVLEKLKEIVDRDPDEARRVITGHPQLPEAILFLMSKLDMVKTPLPTNQDQQQQQPPPPPPPQFMETTTPSLPTVSEVVSTPSSLSLDTSGTGTTTITTTLASGGIAPQPPLQQGGSSGQPTSGPTSTTTTTAVRIDPRQRVDPRARPSTTTGTTTTTITSAATIVPGTVQQQQLPQQQQQLAGAPPPPNSLVQQQQQQQQATMGFTMRPPPPPPPAYTAQSMNVDMNTMQQQQQQQQQNMLLQPPQQQQQQQQQQHMIVPLDPALVQQVMSLTLQQIQQLPPDKQQSILQLRQQITGSMS